MPYLQTPFHQFENLPKQLCSFLRLSINYTHRCFPSMSEQNQTESHSTHHPPAQTEKSNSDRHSEDGVQSQNILSQPHLNQKQKVPPFLRTALRDSHSSKQSKGSGSLRNARITEIVRGRVPSLRKMGICGICQCSFRRGKLALCNCEHKTSFCQSCLHHYVLYRVKTFQEVGCPHQDCTMLIDTSLPFFNQLPIDIQNNYRKIHRFYQAANDPSRKLCPEQDCEGLIQPASESVLECSTCKRRYCNNCLLFQHTGECDSHEVEFFHKNLHYRQCRECKFIIEKNQGCNHMTCRCGFMFCYVCGAEWTPQHYGNHDEQGNLVAPAEGEVPPREECCNLGCMDELCGPVVAFILKLPIKLFLLVFFIVLMLMILVFRDVLVCTGLFIVSITAGVFAFSFQFLASCDGICCLLGVIFFPVCILVGIGMAFRDIFCEVVPDLCEEFWSLFCDGGRQICEM